MHSEPTALYILAGLVVLGVGFLLWALFHLFLETMRRGEATTPPAEPRRWRH